MSCCFDAGATMGLPPGAVFAARSSRPGLISRARAILGALGVIPPRTTTLTDFPCPTQGKSTCPPSPGGTIRVQGGRRPGSSAEPGRMPGARIGPGMARLRDKPPPWQPLRTATMPDARRSPTAMRDNRGMSINLKTAADLEKMREAGRLAAEVLQVVAPFVKPGVTTEELDRICHDHIVNVQGAIPANVGYRGFPKTVCTSVNNVICHGIPSPGKVLKDGDIVNIDVTVIKDGWHGDTSRMY